VLVARGLSKAFAGVPAVVDADLTIERGRIYALLGENGAGKSTLMNLLAGLYRPDAGSLTMDGAPLVLRSPRDAMAAGIGMVHQHFKLVRTMTVAENFAAFSPGPLRFQPRAWQERLTRLAGEHGLALDPSRRVDELSVGEQQRVEILRLLARDARILILDEPTAVLTPPEADALFAALCRLAERGRAVLLVTHKLREVFAVADALTVLRRGKVVMASAAADTDPQSVASAMVGEQTPLAAALPRIPTATATAAALAARSLSGAVLRNLDLTLRAGSITAVVGVSGNGQDELFETLLGTAPHVTGTLELAGRDIRRASIRERQRLGMAFVPPDVRADALLPAMTVAENLVLERIARRPRLGRAGLRAHAAELRDRYQIATPSLETQASALSGGNMQKIALARELAREPKVLVNMNPTRGLDIAASAYVHDQLRALAARQGAVLVITEDLDEAYALADELLVIARGEVVLAKQAADAPREAVGMAMGAGKA
jgi:simple sugar transport system ATP-binding protein